MALAIDDSYTFNTVAREQTLNMMMMMMIPGTCTRIIYSYIEKHIVNIPLPKARPSMQRECT